jgi:hypothetical protein
MNYNYIHQKGSKKAKPQKKVVNAPSKHLKEYRKKIQQQEEVSNDANVERVINLVNSMNTREETVRGVDAYFAHEVHYVTDFTSDSFHADVLLEQLRRRDSELAELIDRNHCRERFNNSYIQHFLLPLVRYTYCLRLDDAYSL